MVSFSNGVLSGDVSNKRPLENGFLPKFKPRRVSAIRDFPPGCGPNAVPINLKSEHNVGSEAEAMVDNNTFENCKMPDLVEPGVFGNSEMTIKTEKNNVKAFETPKSLTDYEMKDSELPSIVGFTGVKNSNIKVEDFTVVDMTESLDILVGNITASENVDVKYLVESVPVGSEFPNEVDNRSHQRIDNPIKVERAVEKVKTTTNEGILNEVDTLNDLKNDSSDKAGELDEMDHVASADKEVSYSLPGSSKLGAYVRPKDRYRMRRVSAVRDFPPNCGRNISSPTEEEKPMVTEGNGCLDVIDITHVRNCPSMKAEATIYNYDGPENVRARKISDRGMDLNPGSLVLKEDEDCGAYDDNTPNPISMYVSDDSDCDTAEPVRRDIVLYSRGERDTKKPLINVFRSANEEDRKIVHCPWRKGKTVSNNSDAKITGGETSWNHNSSRQRIAEVVAKKSRPKSKYRFPCKKLNPGSLVLADDDNDEGHSGDFPTISTIPRKSGGVEVTLPPFGPKNTGHGNSRDKVRNTLRLFNAICRKLLQKEEAKSTRDDEKKLRRIDLFAAKIIKEKGKEVNTGKQILGEVPGVEVGDEFQYRVELAVVGIHRLYQAGIDSMKLNNGVLVATSIVSSGSYADDLENNDVLLYSGQGGNVVGKQRQKPEDQKLERGNLALKNSIETQTPVRVVRGWREKTVDPLDSKHKLVPIYVYDGLYTVTRYWPEIGPHGKKVFMFELRRNPGQPELTWKELKKSNKARSRPSVCIPDICRGKEPFAICAVNAINDEKPPPFNYISKMMYPGWHNPVPPSGCDCTGRCSDSKRCLCAIRNGGQIPYNRNGALVETKLLVYECGPHCKCPPSCYNRVTQRGIRYQLEIYKTESRGWGMRALTSIPSGSFICEYAGELLEDTEAEQRIGNDEYLFDIGQNLSDSSQNPEDQTISAELVEDGGYTIDACQYGNIGRFINHSCSPNLHAQNVIYDHDDMKMSHVMLFAMENIPPLKELTYHYNYSVDQIRDSSGNIKVKKCYCGSAQCTGRMY